MVDAYEQNHGPVDDRSIFDGEITVPPHLRNMSLTNVRPNRLHSGLFGSLSRSRTFLTIPTNSRHTFHGSVPNLSHIFTDRCAQTNQMIDTRNGNNTNHSRHIRKPLLLNQNTSKMTSLMNVSTPLLDESLRHSGGDGISNGRANNLNNNDDSVSSWNEVELRNSSIEPIAPSQTDSYMTLIQTNVHNRSSHGGVNRLPLRATLSPQNGIHLTDADAPSMISLSTVPPSPMPSLSKTTDTFHPAPKSPTEEPSLNNLSKFTLPRVSLSNLSNMPGASLPSSTSVTPTATLKRFN